MAWTFALPFCDPPIQFATQSAYGEENLRGPSNRVEHWSAVHVIAARKMREQNILCRLKCSLEENTINTKYDSKNLKVSDGGRLFQATEAAIM